MNETNLEQIKQVALEVALKAADEAGRKIVELRRNGQVTIDYKGEVNLVTTADLAAEKIILDAVISVFPDHPILAEESSPDYSGEALQRGPLWVIDPIDGTTNYAKGHFHVGVSIAFLYDGLVQVGVVGSPFTSEVFHAVRGKGAFLNGEPIQPSKPANLRSALITTGFPYERDKAHIKFLTDRAARVVETCQDLRRLGAASIDTCWVACGRLEGYYETVSPWDIAAAGLVAREAGAFVTNLSVPERQRVYPEEIRGSELVVCAPQIKDQLISVLQGR